jgi:tetratricopeptide (TPR) repeat protein
MRAVLEARSPAPQLPARAHAPKALLVSVGALLAASVLAGGGAEESPLIWIGGGAVLVAAAGLVAVLLGAARRPAVGTAGAAFAALLGGFVLWGGISILWSIAPDRSWDAFNRGAAYFALFGVGVLVASHSRRAPSLTAAALAAVFGIAILWALAGKVVPPLGPDVDRSARLRDPIGYWNALALLVAMSLPLWLWAAAQRRHHPAARAGAVALLFASVVALLLTGSRGGLLVAVVAVAAWLGLSRARLEGAVALLLAVPPGLAVSAWALQRAGLAETGASSRDRWIDGAQLGVALLVVGGLVAAAALGALRREEGIGAERRRRLGRHVALAAGVLVGIALVAGIVRVGNPISWVDARLDEFRNPPSVEVTQDPSRLASFSSNHRWTWWKQAWTIFEDHLVRGTGARTFELARRPIREDTEAPIEPHDLALQALSETGLVGLALLVGAVAAAVLVTAGALRRLAGEERAAAVALAAAGAAYLAHSLIDMGWEYLAVSVPVFLSLGVLAAAGRDAGVPGPRRSLAAAGAATLAVTILVSLALPWLSARKVDDAFAALERGDPSAASAAAGQAVDLDPLAVEPLQVEALAAEVSDDLDDAERLYRQAVELQPRNPATWYELGRFLFESRHDPDNAFRILDRSYALDRYGPAGPLLDEVRAALEARG